MPKKVIKPNLKLKSVSKSDDEFQKYRSLNNDLSGNYDSAFLVKKIVLC